MITMPQALKDKDGFEQLVSSSDSNGSTVLHYAAVHGSIADLSLLVQHGANLAADNHSGATPLHLSCMRGSVPVVAYLISVAPRLLNVVDGNGRTSLQIASLYGHARVVSILIESGATLLPDIDGRTPFHCAAWRGSIDCLQTLLTAFPSDLNCVDVEKATALNLAVAADHPDVVAFLLDNGAAISYDNSGQNCLDVAINRNVPKCVEVIVNHERKKFGAAVVIANIAIYLVYLLFLMSIIFVFPAYTPHPLENRDSLDRLMNVIQKAKEDNRTSLSSYEKIVFCFGHPELRITVLVATVLCLLKELLPMWYTGVAYFKRLSNVCELTVYALTLIFLDPYELLFQNLDIPRNPCPTLVWELAAMATVLGWIVLLLNFQRLPHIGIYIMMIISMVATMLKVLKCFQTDKATRIN
ncbi:transient receptor potential cation channel subfamily A member 1-like [Corticium candelabrum]|uniref:transient receptor potential cation channel subfamily A member 1-like n=1 Tax=Corticium candelabrum TaxID=121492 RepID=UPI002E2724B4|nr:transient receptor potential cation channel subfamily A member 1-like [Corticium candelabrum]